LVASVALIAWAWPVAGIATAVMAYSYYKTYQTVQIVRAGLKAILIDGSSKNADLALKLSVLVLFFALGYSGLICQSLYEVSIGRAKIWGDVIAACMVLCYWDAAPFAYAMANHRLGITAVLKATPIVNITEEISHKPISTGSSNAKTRSGSDDSKHATSQEGSDFSRRDLELAMINSDPSKHGKNRTESTATEQTEEYLVPILITPHSPLPRSTNVTIMPSPSYVDITTPDIDSSIKNFTFKLSLDDSQTPLHAAQQQQQQQQQVQQQQQQQQQDNNIVFTNSVNV